MYYNIYMQPQSQNQTTHDDLKNFIGELEKKYPRDTEYITSLFINFLLLRIVKAMPQDKLKEVVSYKDQSPQKAIEILGDYCRTTTLCAETIDEFRELLNARR